MPSRPFENLFPHTSTLAFGCMGLGGGWDDQPLTEQDRSHARAAVEAALAAGMSVFDHADIYTLGKAEQVFGEILAGDSSLRDRIVLQSKCGIRFADGDVPGRYDFSRAWITRSVEGSLRRLQTECLDVLLLHRPDPLCEPEEVAGAFDALRQSGKVRHLGVSNMHAAQMQRLQNALDVPLVANQLELSLGHLDWLDEGVEVGTHAGRAVNFSSGTLEWCAANGVQVQAWAPLAGGRFTGKPGGDVAVAVLVQEMGERYGVSPEAIVLAWLLRHPVGIQPVIGTTNPDRIAACAAAMNVDLERDDWYRLYVAARGRPLP